MASSRNNAANKASATELTGSTKKAKVIALLRRNGGATLAEITETTAWLPHSARAVLTGLRKKGFAIEKSKGEGNTRWSITGEPSA